jgi:Mucin-2 protein WxxW repeating region
MIMKKSLVIVSLSLILVLSLGLVSAGWTDWYNRDSPGASGDYETVKDFIKEGKNICQGEEITGIECQTRDGRDYSETEDKMTCRKDVGSVCRNADQEDGRCENYQVRFLCGEEETCTDSDGGKNYYVKGEVITAGVNVLPDSCVTATSEEGPFMGDGSNSCRGDSCYIKEAFCDGEGIGYSVHSCPNGCVDGACIREETISGCEYITNEIKQKVIELQKSGEPIIFVEGDTLRDDDYFILHSGDYTHLMKVTKMNMAGPSFGGTGYIPYSNADFEMKNVITGIKYLVENKYFGFGQNITMSGQTYTITNVSAQLGPQGEVKVTRAGHLAAVKMINYESCFEEEQEKVELHSAYISEDGKLFLDYSKNFGTCTHIYKKEQYMSDGRNVGQGRNFICSQGENVVVSDAMDLFQRSVSVGDEIKICHGNDATVCSEFVTVTDSVVEETKCVMNDIDPSDDVDIFICSQKQFIQEEIEVLELDKSGVIIRTFGNLEKGISPKLSFEETYIVNRVDDGVSIKITAGEIEEEKGILYVIIGVEIFNGTISQKSLETQEQVEQIASQPSSLCLGSSCKLFKDEDITTSYNGKSLNFKIKYLDSSSVILKYNGNDLGALQSKQATVFEGINLEVNELGSDYAIFTLSSGICTGCSLNNKCYNIGYRTSSRYCEDDGNFIGLKPQGITCVNSFECDSQICIDTCIDKGQWENFLDRFKSLFRR